MSLFKRGTTWWTDFSVNAQRYRQSLRTTDWRVAQAQEKELVARATAGKLSAGGQAASLARLSVDEAFDRYLAERRTEIQSARQEGWLAKPLRAFFRGCGKRLHQLTADDVRAYQAWRLEQGRAPKTANHEVKLLLRLLKRAKVRYLLGDDVQLLPVVKAPKAMLSPEEKCTLFETASSRPSWFYAYCAAFLTANTSLRPCELKRLWWGDIDPAARVLTVRRSKTEAGSRTIPLNEEAWSAICALGRRAQIFGFTRPEHFVFHRQRPIPDGAHPMTSWRTAWRALRKAAGFPRLRHYDLRHQFVTELCELGVPESVIRELAGHVDPAMTRWYSHPRMAARREAVAQLSALTFGAAQSQKEGGAEGGYGTNHVTNLLPGPMPQGEVTDSAGTPGRI